MHKENIQKVIDLIKSSPDEVENNNDIIFNMENFLEVHHSVDLHQCGTAACIAGFACIASDAIDIKNDGKLDIEQRSTYYWKMSIRMSYVAQCFLGLDNYQAHDLFLPSDIDLIKKEDAIWTLENLLETGEIVWRHLEKDNE